MLRQTIILLALAASVPACGEDEAPPPPPPVPGAPAPAAPGAPAPAPGSPMQARIKVEQRVTCPPVEKGTGDVCKPDTPSCGPGLFCIPSDKGTSCEPCPERETIRHEFKDRDFVSDMVRDPFQSFVIEQPGLIDTSEKKVEGPCTRPEQFVATNYSYLDLKLVGIVAQGTQRKVLMMDRGNLGHIIRRGDCVGKEKAVVKDIGTGYVTFVIAPDPDSRNPNKVAEERSVQLHPKGLQVTSQPTMEATPAPTAPIVAPPGAPAPSGPPSSNAPKAPAGAPTAAPAPASKSP